MAFHVLGHAYFMEDGAELYNYVTGNLGVASFISSALLKSDQKPAIFWTATPSNFWRDNAAANGEKFGFWIELPGELDGYLCPFGQQLGEFDNNTVHSNVGIGLRVS